MLKEPKKPESTWTFLTNHSHVLLCLAKSPSARIRDLALEIGITERAVQRIVSDLTEGGYIDKIKDGRSNTYTVDITRNLKHPIESHRKISDLISVIYGVTEINENKTDFSDSCVKEEEATL